MAAITPFRGIFFNPTTVPDLGAVAAFPPDPFVAKGQSLPVELPAIHINRLLQFVDRPIPPSIEEMRAPYSVWRQQKVLIEETDPAFYVTEESFQLRGKSFRRKTLYAMVNTQTGRSLDTIVPHERTDPKRLERFGSLLRAFQANVSPIFALYEDARGAIRSNLQKAWGKKVLIQEFHYADPRLGEGLTCRLYRLPKSPEREKMINLFKKCPLFIADGHHRYEAALQVGAPWVLMGLTAVEDPGLQVLPIHRLINVPVGDREGLMRRLGAAFQVGRASKSTGVPKDSITMITKGSTYGLKLPPESGEVVGLLLSLQHVLEGTGVAFTVEPEHVNTWVEQGDYSHGFLVPPLKVKDILEVVRKRGVLPVKSTYFFPKLFSGLVMASTPVPN